MSSALADALKAGRFVVTSELTPPKGTDPVLYSLKRTCLPNASTHLT